MPKVAASALQLAATLLLARALQPEGFGPLAVCLTIILLTDGIVGSAIDSGVVKLATLCASSHSVRSLEIQKAALAGKFLAVVAIGVPVLIVSPQLTAVLFQTTAPPILLPLAVLASVSLMLLRSVQTHLQLTGRFLFYGLADTAQAGLKVIGVGLLLFFDRATAALALGWYAAAPLLVAVVLLASVARGIATARFSFDALKAVASTVGWYVGAGAVGSITSRVDVFFVSTIAGAASAGLFSAAQILVMPFWLVGTYLSVAFAPRVMPLWQSGELRSVYARFQTRALLACIAIFLIALVAAEPVTRWLLPPSFHETGGLALALLPASLAGLLIFPWTVSFLLFTSPRLLFACDLVALPVLFVSYRAAVGWRGATGAAIVTAGYALVKAAVLQLVAWRALRRGCPEHQSVPGLALAG